MHWRTLVFLLLPLVCRAQDAPKSAEQWVGELKATYAKQQGYFATYRSEGENKKLEALLGLDKASGLVVFHLDAEVRGKKIDAGQWNTRDGDFFIQADDQTLKISGIRRELQNLVDLRTAVDRRLADLTFKFELHVAPIIVVDKESLGQGIMLRSKDEPAWDNAVEDASVTSFDEKSVTFATKNYGALTVSRENGIMTRQSVTADDGEVRTLELAKLQLNPGDKAVEAVSAAWKTLGAKQGDAGALLASLRQQIFNEIVALVESGKGDLAKLETVLGEQEDALRQFAAACLSDTRGMAGDPKTKAMFDQMKEALRENWKKTAPEDKRAEKDFEAYLAAPEFRKTVRDKFVETVFRDNTARKRVILELFGPRSQGDPLRHDETGKAAQELIDQAVTKAYFQAMVERRMAAQWGEREGME